MKCDKELTYDVYLGDYQVSPESATDIIGYISDGVCPMCSTDNEELLEIPEPGATTIFICSDCGIRVTIEAWWVK